ncbi:uncharacterized protein LOC110711376 [Chenopodium quinoa]|uniref:Stress induced protein n=1 Tax=Chenopodium quinoa TaxID=63459 RepID=A0A803N6U4_CHEQI|nr:uncharacterized protein LOC110711376 [Chenopodium quinoa]
MATPQENAFLMQAGELESEEQGCGCFRSFGVFTSHNHTTNSGDRLNLLPERREERESWVMRQVKKLREVSELVAGPKWKNFLRKIGGYFNNKKRNDFQYNSFDYTLNFDNGNYDDDKDGNLGFSSRFAPPVVLHDKPRSST